MPEPLVVEIIAYAPTAFYHCQHCELVWNQTGFSRGVRQEQVENGLPEDLLREYATLSDWVRDLVQRHCGRVMVRVIDVTSIEGVWKSLRYGARRYPAIIVDGREKVTGMDFSQAEAAIQRRLLIGKESGHG